MYFIYILYSESADKYYVGHTDDYIQRFSDHNIQESFDTYTSKHRPWKMKAVFECGPSRSDALKIERFIKKQKSRRLIETLLNPEFMPNGVLAQLVRVPHLRD